jgi:hypothetical protein
MNAGLFRRFQRRVRSWRLELATGDWRLAEGPEKEGPEKEGFFRQGHQPGITMAARLGGDGEAWDHYSGENLGTSCSTRVRRQLKLCADDN